MHKVRRALEAKLVRARVDSIWYARSMLSMNLRGMVLFRHSPGSHGTHVCTVQGYLRAHQFPSLTLRCSNHCHRSR